MKRTKVSNAKKIARWIGLHLLAVTVVFGLGSLNSCPAGDNPQEVPRSAARLLPPVENAPQDKAPSLPAPKAGKPSALSKEKLAPVTLAPVPDLLPAAKVQPITMTEALQRAGVANPAIALAWEAVRESQAMQLKADVLLLPDLNAGCNFDLHRENLETSRGVFLPVNRQALYVGAGAGAVAAGTVTVPGVSLTAQLAEAWYEPQATREQVAGRRFDALATRNNVLLEVTARYLALAGAEADLRALQESEKELLKAAQVTSAFAITGVGLYSDAERARSDLLLEQNREERAQEAIAVASADLARVLDLDPSVRLRPAAEAIPLVQLIDPQQDLERLIQIALRNRPEVAARTADVAVSATRLREEVARPLLPFVSLGFSAGDFGGGSDQTDTRFGHVAPRVDIDAMAVWTADSLGLGNLALQRQRRAQLGEAQAQRARVIDQVRREVAAAQAEALARRRQLDLDLARVERAKAAYREDFLRIRNRQGRPIELMYSLRLLTAARQALVMAIVQYDQAQYQLFVALGQPPPP
jgi:outer membrane protein TolC